MEKFISETVFYLHFEACDKNFQKNVFQCKKSLTLWTFKNNLNQFNNNYKN